MMSCPISNTVVMKNSKNHLEIFVDQPIGDFAIGGQPAQNQLDFFVWKPRGDPSLGVECGQD